MAKIHFRILTSNQWQTARNEKGLREKLNGEMAEIHMPAKPFWVRLWRKVFPLQFTEVKMGHE